jgi:hypothetical protein
MKKNIILLGILLSLVEFRFCVIAQEKPVSPGYRNVKDVQTFLQTLQKGNPSAITLHKIASSPGGTDITVMEIGSNLKQVPAIFVGANFEGNTPLATEGALHLAKMLLDSSRYAKNLKWFILPLANPDAAAGFFTGVKWERAVNNMDVNNDTDDQLNEDGPDDLDGDGLITRIRVEDPEGTYIVYEKDPRLMIKADPKKGERGKYKIYTEGLDNDGDGAYNEDGPGGVNVGISFPHLFNARDKESGLWPGEAPESYGIMSFIFNHPEIVMAYTLGSSDFCMSPPRSSRTGGASMESIKVPARFASRMGADPEKNYTMAQVLEMAKSMMPGGGGREIPPDMIVSMLGLGAAVNPLEDDQKFYTDFSEQYKEYLKKKGYSTDRIAAASDKDGSFELWAYYHLGVPSFSMNLFTIPKPPAEKPAEGGGTAGGGERSFPSAGMMAGMMRNMGQAARPVDPDENNKTMLNYIDKYRKEDGFVKWKPYTHPTLGKCDIGGFAPYLSTTPPAAWIDSLCNVQLPWLLRLSTKIPDIEVLNEKVTSLGAGVYKLELFIENKGYLPYPIAMGVRNRQPAPVIITLEGDKTEFLEGIKRTPLGDIGGNQVKKLTWILRAEKKCVVTVKVESAPFGNSTKQIEIGG